MKFNNLINKYLLEVKQDVSSIKSKINSLAINLEPYDDLRQIDVDGIIKMEYEVMEDQVYIEHIEVNKDYRKLGLSKLLLTKFLKETDRKNLPVTLMVYPTDDTTEEQLISIYKKFGFEVYGKDAGNNRPLMRREVITESKNMIGYKVMNYENGKAVSGADSRQTFPLEKGKVVSMKGRSIFLTLDKQYAIDYYAQHDQNAVITMEFDPSNVTGGNLTDKETEFTVSKAKIIDFEIIDGEDL